MLTPLSPADSVNLLPGFRKNFNARKVFKKAVRAVGILRKMQTAGSSSGSFGSSESQDSIDTTSSRKSRPLSFQDIVAAAIVSKKGLDGVHEDEEEEVHETLEKLEIKDA